MYSALLPGCVACLLALIRTTSAGPRGPGVGGQGRHTARQARQARSGNGDSLASGQPERAWGGGWPRAWGTVGTGQAGSPGRRARRHASQDGRVGKGHGWARGSGSSGGPNKRAGSPARDRPAVPGRTARAVPAPLPGPRDRARETRGRSALTPGVRDPGTSPTRRVRDRGRRRNTGGPRAVGWRARADSDGGRGAEARACGPTLGGLGRSDRLLGDLVGGRPGAEKHMCESCVKWPLHTGPAAPRSRRRQRRRRRWPLTQ